MKLWNYVGENVVITTIDGVKFIGEVTNYEDYIANDSGEDSIHFDDGIVLFDFNESEIKSIEIID
ncbi:LSM domain protein [Staphylococcus delphini]|uniref:LSM domain protein n=1 Tax=Staphylococcus delphini TaxID=53344 RepID=UPI0023B347FB|nr:LSM domain protein [Staphylococcus delphini]MDE9752302.1 LSM domain protein [Staphylococcus delphini]MDE9789735.1 LSM domain protein [Staphylococcus delphini]MDE9793123.1 LSM domain protein [Staphylococcus delphini]MDE9794595.1 LSM domain protein [Staphylococcus delphini]MDE9798022.1 LSM domain protein [Staphylococcus delphini]